MRIYRTIAFLGLFGALSYLSFTPSTFAQDPNFTGSGTVNLNKVEGLELPFPAEYDAEKKFVRIKPKFTEGWSVKKITYKVISVSEKPLNYDDLGEQGLTVALPPPGQSAFIYAYAHLTKEIQKDIEFPYDTEVDGKKVRINVKTKVKTLDHKVTEDALTVIKTRQDGVISAPPEIPQKSPTQGVVGPTEGVPDVAKNIHAILVFDVKAATADLGALTRSESLRAAFNKSGSKVYFYDKEDPILVSHKILPRVQELGQVPCLLVVSGTKVLPAGKAIPFPIITSDRKPVSAKQLETQLLDVVNKSVGGQ
jgi:hypothetical protein